MAIDTGFYSPLAVWGRTTDNTAAQADQERSALREAAAQSYNQPAQTQWLGGLLQAAQQREPVGQANHFAKPEPQAPLVAGGELKLVIKKQDYGSYTCTYNVMHGITTMFQARVRPGNCCGFKELCEFIFYYPMTVEQFTPLFAEIMANMKGFSAAAHLALTNYQGSDHQPAWFRECVAAWPHAMGAPWMYNPNSGNNIQVWILPTGAAPGDGR